MLRLYVLCAVTLLTACNTTTRNTADISKVNTSNPYIIGYYVKYSEICAQFRGSGAGNLHIRSLRQKYKRDARFAEGYAINDGLEVFDSITNLPDCDLAKAVVDKASGVSVISAKGNNSEGVTTAYGVSKSQSSTSKLLADLYVKFTDGDTPSDTLFFKHNKSRIADKIIETYTWQDRSELSQAQRDKDTLILNDWDFIEVKMEKQARRICEREAVKELVKREYKIYVYLEKTDKEEIARLMLNEAYCDSFR